MRGGRFRLGLAALLALFAAGCTRPPHRADNDVRFVLYSDVSSLSLIGNTDQNAAQIASLISDGLVAYDAQTRYVPMVARSWEISPDGRSVTFRLRDGVRWHDGTRVTSRDVAFTADKIRDPATQARSWISQFSEIDRIDTPDDGTVVVHYRSAFADALDPWRVPLLPEHIASKDPDFLAGAFANHPVGCGPLRFVSRIPGQSIVLQAFDDYWGGRPALDHLVFRIISSERTGYEALLLGEVDLMGVTSDIWRQSLGSAAAARLRRFVYYRLSAWKIDWNQDGSNPFFGDVRVRRAMILALDRKRFASTVAAGLARPGIGSYAPESPWSNPAIGPLPFDPAESARLLDEAGWRRGAGGVRAKNGTSLAFTMLLPAGPQEIADRTAVWMQQSLADMGVAMTIEKLEWNAFRERRARHAFQALMSSLSFDATPDQFELFHSSARNGGYNFGGFSDPDVDRLLESGRRTLDPDARRAIYFELQQRLHELEPVSFLFQFAQPVLHDPDLEGVAASPVGLLQFAPGPRAWRWSDARARR